jgi:hypothetical protein
MSLFAAACVRAILVALLAKAASAQVAAMADFAPESCPVVGNRFSGIYHTAADMNYRQMLVRNRNPDLRDNRECFPSAEAAEGAGYRRSRAPKTSTE